MLFVWLFALASGVANACLLEPHGVHDHGSPLSHLSAATDTTLGMAGDHAEGFTHDDGDSDTGPAKESCQTACDEGSRSLLKRAYSFDLADPGLAPFVATAWAAEVHLSRASGRPHDFRLPERGPPIRVLFSRLALWPSPEIAPECCTPRFASPIPIALTLYLGTGSTVRHHVIVKAAPDCPAEVLNSMSTMSHQRT